MVALRRGGRRGRADTGYRACTSRCTRRHQHRENHRSRPAGHSDAAETTPPRSPHPPILFIRAQHPREPPTNRCDPGRARALDPGGQRNRGTRRGDHAQHSHLLTSTPPSPDKDHHRSGAPKQPHRPEGSVPATLLAGPVSPGTHHGKLLASSTAFILRPAANHSPTASPPAMTICSPG